ncbi:MAG: hypothetical protein OEZ35_03075 [Candidatus Bathyarchaeota archaeon]|nr:hypothetical protein [Candidatus Bathyarchaeota archaeon]
MSSSEKVKVYVYSLKEIPTQDYVDMESIRHPCSQAGERAFDGLKNYPRWDGVSGYLSDEERKARELAAQFCGENKLDLEIIDLANVGFAKKAKLFLAGVRKVPAIALRGEIFTELSSIEKLKTLPQK